MTPDDMQFLDRIVANLNVLADLSHADILLYAAAEDGAVVVAQSHPTTVPSLYPFSLVGKRVTAEEAGPVLRVLRGRPRHVVVGTMVRGAPSIQELFPILGPNGQTIAVLSSEMSVLETERQRKKNAVYRRAIARVRELVLAGRLEGGEQLSRISEHDGTIVIDARGEIQYISTVAEHLYRRLGYDESLLHTQISMLDTNEYICFKAMESGRCLEQRVQEQDYLWVKRVIPLLPEEPKGWVGRLWARRRTPEGAIIVIQDVTDEVRKEQELKIKTAMIQEIHHRVKNNLHTIAALLRLQARRTSSPEVANLLRQTIHRILSVAVVHEFLSHDESAIINIHEVSNRILSEITRGILDPEKRIKLVLEGDSSFLLPAQQATSCALIINELLQNAVEHGFADRDEGTVSIRLCENGDSMMIEIRDDGRGLPPDFEQQRRHSLGLQIVETLVRGDLRGEFQLRNGNGVVAQVSFPKVIAREHLAEHEIVVGR